MVSILFRAFSTVVTVAIAVVVSTTVGDGAEARLLGAIVIAAIIATVETFLVWAPKHSATFRRLLDPRSNLIGCGSAGVTSVPE